MPGVVLTYLCSRIPGVRWADAFMLVGSERGELCVEATAARHVGLFGVLDVRLCYAMCFGLHFICACGPLLHRSRKARGPFKGDSLGSFFGVGMLTAAPESSANDPAIIDGCSLEQSVVLSVISSGLNSRLRPRPTWSSCSQCWGLSSSRRTHGKRRRGSLGV